MFELEVQLPLFGDVGAYGPIGKSAIATTIISAEFCLKRSVLGFSIC